MAWVLQLDDGTSTVLLSDGTFTTLNRNGFSAPPPERRFSWSGGNLARTGADLIERQYENRRVTVDFQIAAGPGGTAGSLQTTVRNIWSLLRKAEEFNRTGNGTAVYLRYGWESGSGTVSFAVVEGVLDLGQFQGDYLSQGTRIHSARLELTCEPFAYGTAESVSNYIADPSFEVAGAPLADWTLFDGGTGTTQRSTAQAHWGTASLFIRRDSGGLSAVNIPYALQMVTTGWTAGDTAQWGVYVLLVGAAPGVSAVVQRGWYNTAGTDISFSIATTTLVSTSTWQLLQGTNDVAPAAAGTLRLLVGLRDVGTGTAYFDNVYLIKGSLPTAWVSGRSVANHFDNNGQAHINYLDVYGIPGDVPALLQIQATENEAHTDFWVGARHAGRMTSTLIFLEGEGFTGSGTMGTAFAAIAVADASNGSVGTANLGAATLSSGSFAYLIGTIATPPAGAYRVLTRMSAGSAGPTSGTILGTLLVGAGYSYGSIVQRPTATADLPAVWTGATSGAYRIVDIGQITIPPVTVPPGGTIGSLILQVAMHSNVNPGTLPGIIGVDWVMLMPYDQGFAYVSKASNADVVWADARTNPPAIYLMNTSSVMQQVPANQQGRPPEAHPQGSRFYFAMIGGNTSSVGAGLTVAITYVPRYLQI